MMTTLRTNEWVLTTFSQILPSLIGIFLIQFINMLLLHRYFQATINSLSDGMQYSWSAPVLPVLQSQNNTMHIQKQDEFWLESCFLLAGVLGLPISIYLTKTVGRRNTIFIGSIIAFTSWCIIGFTKQLEYLYVGRVLGGLTGSMSYVATAMYLSEIARPDIRGFLASLDHLLFTFGMLVVYSIVPFCPFYVHAVFGATLGLLQVITLPFIPQSPYYLAESGKIKDAKEALNRLRNTSDNEEEFNELVQSIAVERVNNEKNIFFKKGNRKLLLMITILSLFQQFSGFVTVQMNICAILKEILHVFVLSYEHVGIIFSSIVLFSTLVQTVTVDTLGRRKILIISSFFTGICSFLIATYFTIKQLGIKNELINWSVVGVFLFYAVFERLGLGYLPQVLYIELFPTGVKAIGMAYDEFLFRVLGSLTLGFYHYFGNNYGMNVPFFVFSATSFVSAVYTIFVVPETTGKSLKQTQEIIT